MVKKIDFSVGFKVNGPDDLDQAQQKLLEKVGNREIIEDSDGCSITNGPDGDHGCMYVEAIEYKYKKLGCDW